MDWKNLHGYIEVSPFLLFESTGDSEQDSGLGNSSFDDDNVHVETHDEVDDAQSCCSESSDEIGNACDKDQFQECSYSKKADHLVPVHGRDYDSNKRHRNDYDEDEDDDDGAISQECSSRNAGFGYSTTQLKKCKVYVDSRMESMKKEEKDKLFWDACLAS